MLMYVVLVSIWRENVTVDLAVDTVCLFVDVVEHLRQIDVEAID